MTIYASAICCRPPFCRSLIQSSGGGDYPEIKETAPPMIERIPWLVQYLQHGRTLIEFEFVEQTPL
jgi:hypothetical protein